jgi:dihydrofolate reductase
MDSGCALGLWAQNLRTTGRGNIVRKLVVTEFMSLDGVVQAPGDPQEDTEGGFAHGGWQRPYFDEVFMRRAAAGMAETDAQLFGRKTYDKMAAFWPTVGDDDPFAKHLNHVPKYVASRNMTEATWEGTTVLNGDVVEQVREIKERDGGTISVLGSADLAQTLMAHDLIDEYSLAIHPILLGSGKKLFRDAEQVRTLELVDSTPTTTGVLLATYRPTR